MRTHFDKKFCSIPPISPSWNSHSKKHAKETPSPPILTTSCGAIMKICTRLHRRSALRPLYRRGAGALAIPLRAANVAPTWIRSARVFGWLVGSQRQRKIPRLEDANEVLAKATGWQLVAVPGLIPDDVFFDHLANKRFPVSWWMRKAEEVDYLVEPDIFPRLFWPRAASVKPGLLRLYAPIWGRRTKSPAI